MFLEAAREYNAQPRKRYVIQRFILDNRQYVIFDCETGTTRGPIEILEVAVESCNLLNAA